MIENERKYLFKNIDKEKIEELKKKASKRVGIIQWYEDRDDSEDRTRLTVSYDKIIGHTYLWEKTSKKPTDDPQKRDENEKTLDPRRDVNLSDFENKKSVIKIRYIIKEDPEIVLDEFLKMDNSDNLEDLKIEQNEYYLEIEVKQKECDFEKELKNLNLQLGKDIEDVTGEKAHKNIQKAQKSTLKPLKMIDYVQNKLIGPVTVVVTQGQDLNRDCAKVLKKLKNGENTDTRGEMEALFLFKKAGFEIKKVYFLVFPGEGNENFYQCLSEFAKYFFNAESQKEYIDYIPEDQESAYISTAKIWEVLEEINKKENQNILIDITGGHKYPGVAVATYCLLNQKPFYYKQNNTMVHLKFPPYPIGWNYEIIDDNSAYLEEIKFDDIDYSVYSTLPKFLKDFFSLSPDESRLINISTISEIKSKYENARKMPFGHGKNFIDLIRDEKMINFVNEKIPLWSLRWIGDLIPETVEHSQRHSKRLMEFGFNLVRVMGEEYFLNGIDPALKKEFYFVLAVAMNVHDLGHTVLNYRTDDGIEFCIDGLPSVVRDLHSELSYQLLEEGNLLDGIEKIDNDEIKIERLKRAIMYVSKYHRQYLPISKEERPEEKVFARNLRMKIKSLEERLNEDKLFEDAKDWKEMIMLAARWLKFIDSTDVQSDRTVMEEYTQIRVERTKEEIKSLCYDFLSNAYMLCKLDISDKIANVLKYLSTENWKALDETAKEIESVVYKDISCNLEKANENGKNYIFVDEYIKKLDRIAFKSRQFLHFKKHQAVKSVMPEFYDPKTGELHIKIYSEGDSTAKIIEDIKEDIEKEFTKSNLSSFNKNIAKLDIEV